MASCECCWNSSYLRQASGSLLSQTDAYYVVMKEHQERGCVCTKNTDEGREVRAGQFWRDGKDTREAK